VEAATTLAVMRGQCGTESESVKKNEQPNIERSKNFVKLKK